MKTFRKIHALFAAGGLALLAGCATVYEDQFQFSHGWRVAEVVRVAPASAIDNPTHWECLRQAPEAARQDDRYILLSYRAFARKRQTLHPLPPGMNLKPGDRVYVKPGSCDEASIIKRVSASQRPALRGAGPQSEPHQARDFHLPREQDAGVQRARRSERHMHSEAARSRVQRPSHKSGAQEGDAIEELVRWIS